MNSYWYVYILKCKNDYLYTGISPDINKRIQKYILGEGAKSLRGRLLITPVPESPAL